MSFLQGQTPQKVFSEWLKDSNLSNAHIACSLFDLDKGNYLLSHKRTAWMTPASTVKLVTTATAMGILGADFVYETGVLLDGKIDNGVLEGDLVIVGSGDPTFGSNEVLPRNDTLVLEQIRKALLEKGIKKINGHIRVNVGLFGTDALGPQWPWEDIGNYYGGGAWALNYRENEYDIFFQQNRTTGSSVTMKSVNPFFPGLELVNEVKTGKPGSGDNAYIFGAPYTYYKHIRGTIPPGNGVFDIQGAMPEPPYQFGWFLKSWLQEHNLTVLGQVLIDRKPLAKLIPLHVFESKPLSWITTRTNEESVNLYAEALMRTIGQKKYGVGTIENGVKAIFEFWKEKGINLNAWKMVDGSGLSPNNLVRVQEFIQILQKLHSDESFGSLVDQLPVAGVNGTMKYFLRNSNLQYLLKGKSGSISNCRNYVGYFSTKSGRPIAFTIFINQYPEDDARKQIEQLFKKLWLTLE